MVERQYKQIYPVLLLASFVSTVGIGIIVPILPIYAKTLGASGVWIGLIFSGFSISQFFLMPVVGRLSDVRGRKKFIVTGLFLYTLVSLGLLFAKSPVMLTVVRLGQGCGAAMIIPIAQAYMGEMAPPSSEGKYMGMFSVALFTGFGLGPLLGGILKDLYGMSFVIYTLCALTFLAGVLVLLLLPDIQQLKKNPSLPAKTVFEALGSRVVRSVIAFRATTAMCRGALIAFVPILVHNSLNLSSSQIGIAISVSILLTSLLQAPFGILADNVDKKQLVVLGGIFLHVVMLLFPFVTTFTKFIILCFFYGICGALVIPAVTAIMVGEGRIYGMGSAMSLFNMSMNLGLAVGPPVGGWIMDAFGLNFVFYLFSLIGFSGISLFGLGSRAMNYQRA